MTEDRALSEGTEADRQRRQRAAEAHRLHELGWTAKAIAQHLNCSAKTIRRYLQRQSLPAPRQGSRRTKLDAFKSFLVKRWNEGCHNAAELFRELESQGFAGSITIVRTYVAALRQISGLAPRSRQPGGQLLPEALAKRLPSYRRLAWLATQLEATLDEEDQHYVDLVSQINLTLQTTIEIAREFTTMVCGQQPEQLDAWIAKATESGVSALRSLGNGLREDYDAVRAALTLPWSNGRTEGHVNRLKCLKRQMYGRAKLDLLRARVMVT